LAINLGECGGGRRRIRVRIRGVPQSQVSSSEAERPSHPRPGPGCRRATLDTDKKWLFTVSSTYRSNYPLYRTIRGLLTSWPGKRAPYRSNKSHDQATNINNHCSHYFKLFPSRAACRRPSLILQVPSCPQPVSSASDAVAGAEIDSVDRGGVGDAAAGADDDGDADREKADLFGIGSCPARCANRWPAMEARTAEHCRPFSPARPTEPAV
jgi:hypothetical protein